MRLLYSILSLRKCVQRWPYNFAFNAETFKFRSSSTISRTGFDNYEEARISWNFEIPENFNFAADVLDVWADKEKTGERNNLIPAFWFAFEDGRQLKWSFQDFQRETMRTACMLEKQCGLKKSDIVMVMLPKMPEFWLVNIAAIRIGFILSPGSMTLTAKDIAYRFSTLKPSCIIAHETVVDLIDQVADCCSSLKTKIVVSSTTRRNTGWLDFHSLYKNADTNHKCAETKSNESMMVFFSSGTTGLPKMIEHSHSSYGLALAVTGRYWLDLTSENILWNMSDTGWAKTAYSNIFAPWSCGACVFIHQMSRYSPDTALKILSEFPIDTLCAPPLAYRTMVHENITSHDFPKLTHCVSAGEALNPEIIRLWEQATNLKIYEGYGQTETVLLIGMFKCLDYKPGSIGKPAPGIDVVILDENENELGAGLNGEIALVRKKEGIFGLFNGYRNNPEMTKLRLTEKYFHTGDMAYYDEDGYFWFVGRNDDVINSAGYRIGPFEVESALMEHPAVVEVAVTSSPDPSRGEVVKAFIVLKDTYCQKNEQHLIKELQDHSKRVTAPYKYPRKIEFVKELPKTTSGKIKRFELREKEWKKN